MITIKNRETFFFKATLFLIIFLNIYGAVEFFLPNIKKGITIFISILGSQVLVPSLKYIQTRGVNRIQLKWMFLRKPLILNC